MKKVLALVGSPRKGETYQAVQVFERKLKALGEISFETIFLKEVNLEMCRGCLNCFIKGEAFCPLKDDREMIVQKMMEADGVIFATPVYSLQVSAQMKVLLDRLAYIFHRPSCFHKAFIPIVTQGVYGNKEVIKYLNSVAEFWGFNLTAGVGLNTSLGIRSIAAQQKMDQKLEKAAADFYGVMMGNPAPVPKLKNLAMFRMVRSTKPYIGELPRDFEYFKEKGWMTSDYYYEVKLGFFMRLIGKFLDWQGEKAGAKILKEQITAKAQLNR